MFLPEDFNDSFSLNPDELTHYVAATLSEVFSKQAIDEIPMFPGQDIILSFMYPTKLIEDLK